MDYAEAYKKLLRTLVKRGMRIRLISMNDGDVSAYKAIPHTVKEGTEGTVLYIDDANQIHVSWDSGESLAIIPETDMFEIIGVSSN